MKRKPKKPIIRKCKHCGMDITPTMTYGGHLMWIHDDMLGSEWCFGAKHRAEPKL